MTYISLKGFYDELVTNVHRTGDIWSNLPTHGLLKESTLPGVVITPACDLANDKVETISYLPIISIQSYLATNCFLPEIKSTILSLSEILKYSECKAITNYTWPPDNNDLEKMTIHIESILSGQPEIKKNKEPCHRFLNLLKHLRKILSNQLLSSDMKELSMIFGEKKFKVILTKIITNSYRNDIHFLPADLQNPSWSAIKNHSVIMFRYPLTAPIEIFDLAQSSLSDNWSTEVESSYFGNSFAESFKQVQPIKTLRLHQHLLHDMLNRFVSLYSRLGSPNFNSSTSDKILMTLTE